MLKILADENMPYVQQLFSSLGHIVTKAGRDINANDLIDVDILLVRSITKVNEQLLKNANKLAFVGSATIGTDHIDDEHLASRDIAWSNAPGCNANAVAEYVLSVLCNLSKKYQTTLTDKTVAIVGAGNIGQRLAGKLTALGISHFFCDPPLKRAGANGDYRDWEEVAKADIISLHVPITHHGRDATLNMVDSPFLGKLKPGCILINSCRGDVVDNQALLVHLQAGHELHAVMDVWQNEPQINHALLKLVDIATPHIAGYSLEGKARGTFMLYEKWCQLSKTVVDKYFKDLLPISNLSHIRLSGKLTTSDISKLMLLTYDVRDDDDLCRHFAKTTKGFDNLRKQYKVRRELSALTVHCNNHGDGQLLEKLGVNVETSIDAIVTIGE